MATCESLGYFMGFCPSSLLSNLQDHHGWGAACTTFSASPWLLAPSDLLLKRGFWCHSLGAPWNCSPTASPFCQRDELDRSVVTDTSPHVVCQSFRCRLPEGREVVDSRGVAGAGASALKAPIFPSPGVLLGISDILQ